MGSRFHLGTALAIEAGRQAIGHYRYWNRWEKHNEQFKNWWEKFNDSKEAYRRGKAARKKLNRRGKRFNNSMAMRRRSSRRRRPRYKRRRRYMRRSRMRMRRRGRRTLGLPYKLKTKITNCIILTTDTPLGYEGTIRHAYAIDTTAAIQGYITTGASTTNAITSDDLSPFDKTNTLYQYQRVTGVKLEYHPGNPFDTGSDYTDLSPHPLWTRLSSEGNNSATGFIHANIEAFSRTDGYNELLSWGGSKRHDIRRPWKHYFRIQPVKNQAATGVEGGPAGRWYTTDYSGAENTKFGWIYLEQPYNEPSTGGLELGRMIVTKYITLYRPKLTLGA